MITLGCICTAQLFLLKIFSRSSIFWTQIIALCILCCVPTWPDFIISRKSRFQFFVWNLAFISEAGTGTGTTGYLKPKISVQRSLDFHRETRASSNGATVELSSSMSWPQAQVMQARTQASDVLTSSRYVAMLHSIFFYNPHLRISGGSQCIYFR